MADEIVMIVSQRDKTKYAARMTNIQFKALARRLDRDVVASEIPRLLASHRIEKGRSYDPVIVRRWLLNGWNTEQLLRVNRRILDGDALRHSLHWAFPQAYYSVFAITLAYFKSVGYTEDSHGAVIRKFGAEAATKKYPAALCAIASSSPPTPIGVKLYKLDHSLQYDDQLPDTVDGQLAQFLCATRKLDLAEKKRDIRIETKRGRRRISFRPEDWAKVSTALGYTSILSLLYRKRIKANYRDIDTFLHDELQVEPLFLDLLNIVSTLNLVHEVLIAKALGVPALYEALSSLPGKLKNGPHARMPLIDRLAG